MLDRIQLTKDYYGAFALGDKSFVENILTDDFIFSAPPDPLLGRTGYFEKCWPGAGKSQVYDFARVYEHGNEVIVTYELEQPETSKGRNTEILTFNGDKIQRIEVYFGWTVS